MRFRPVWKPVAGSLRYRRRKLRHVITHVIIAFIGESSDTDAVSCFLFSSDRTVKIWRARGGLDSTLEATDNADEVASN